LLGILTFSTNKGVFIMMHPFLQLNDDTQIVYSDIIQRDGRETVKVYIERPVHLGFKSVVCILPGSSWEENDGFSDDDIAFFQELIESSAHLIIRFARQGGLGNASSF
jgi:hypothetical protein